MAEPASLALREQFGTRDQQREVASFGMWIFLITEIMFFGGLFVAYTVYRVDYTQAFISGSAGMDVLLGSINTAILLTSSFTMALAIHSIELGSPRLLSLFLVITIILGVVFLAIKFTEYYEHYVDRKVPGVWFEYAGPGGSHVEMFYVFYFIMTLLHSLHLIIGIGVLLVMLVRTAAGSFSAQYHTAIDIAGLYWSFVDIVWLFLFAILYLAGLHKGVA